MRRTLLIAAVAVAALLIPVIQANEKPTEAYQKAMKDLGAANQALRADVKTIEQAGAYPDYTILDKDSAALKAAFAAAMAFWSAKNVDDAVQAVQIGMKGVVDLEKAAKEKSYDDVGAAAAAIAGTCAGCHAAHRERLPDGSYEIK